MASKDALPKVKRECLESQQAEDLATGGDREETEEKSAKAMASQDALPTVKNEHVESQQAEDLVAGGDREETEEKSEKQAEDLATSGDREETEEKSAKDREKHKSSHTFSFHEDGKLAVNAISCTEAGTVLEALNRSRKFTSLVSNNKGKDIVIVRKTPEKADIATHFPCWLIKEAEELTIKFSPGNQSDPEPPETATITEERKLVTFYVERKGGKNCKKKKFLKNTRITDISYLCIYACEGESAEEALRRDGRFAEIMFQGGSELGDIKGRDSLEIHLPVTEQHNGKTFSLNMRKEKKPSQSITETDSGSQIAEQAAGPAQEQGEPTPSSARSAPANPSAQEQGESTSRSARSFHALPDSGELLKILRSQFKGLVKHMKERENVKGNEGKVLELLREEYGKNIKVFWDVYGVKNLMEKSRSVCVLINNTANLQGTGFLLFDRFILTNAHLIKDFNDSIDVNFRFEIQNLTTGVLLPVKVIAKDYGLVDKKFWLDYALLELNESAADLPPPLLTQYGPPIQCGGMCIIGHPESGVKRVDFCSVIESRQRESVFENNKNLIQWMNWNLSLVAKDSPVITYDTCFFHGASGSPVFDAHGHVVAMHTGGYSYKLGETKSVTEYAIPLQHILEHLWKTMKELRSGIQSFIEVAEEQEAPHPPIAPDTQPDPDNPVPMETSAPPPLLEHFLKMAKERKPDILQRFIEVAKKQEALHFLIADYSQPDPHP